MRKVYIGQVTNANWEAIMNSANRGTYSTTAVTLMDAAGRKVPSGELELNGCIVIESGYVEVILYRLDTGEIVQITDDPDEHESLPLEVT